MRTISYFVMGISLAISPVVLAASVTLTDQQLERVAAGTTDYDPANAVQSSGGAIVGNSSTANLTTSGDVTISDGVQQGARAVNLVNSAESNVANGVNIWDGRINDVNAATDLDVTQGNSIALDQSRTASLQAYARSDSNILRDYTENSSTTHKGSVDTSQEISSAENLPSVDVQVGKGVSLAGQADIFVDAGSLNISNSIALGSTSTTTNVEVGGVAAKNTSSIVLAKADQSFNWSLPQVTYAIKGAGCVVIMGKCDADGSYTLDAIDKTVTLAPFSLENAHAEHIVLDGSTLISSNSYDVALSGSAQSNARAVNLANAAGSVIANAVNVSRTPTVGPNLNLNQINNIVQRR